ncbi:hypothetical protein MNBD_ACTINO01-1995 [hydrothermal vent metagenome]|uniref:Uncharacterized protein n=1 Tax=hydrothermal vent metagenome TaxID=652676 RepID=A0A3B0T033_9ZZZZ
MSPGYPLEADTLSLEIDSCATRIPLHEPVTDLERQSTEIVAPDQVSQTTVGQYGDDIGDRIHPQVCGIQRDVEGLRVPSCNAAS